jgi:hypothetical protein
MFLRTPRTIILGLTPIILVYIGFFAINGMNSGNYSSNSQENIENDQTESSIAVLLMVFGFAFNSSHFCVPLAKERELKITYINYNDISLISPVLRVMGLRPAPFWFANLLADMIFGSIVCAFIVFGAIIG